MNNRSGLPLVFILLLISISSCVSSKFRIENQNITEYLEESATFKNSFTGFSLFDPLQDAYIFRYKDHKFFTPASNTKLFTFYASKKVFSDSIPGIKYVEIGDTIVFSGTGDPTFLHPLFKDQPVYNFLSDTSKTLIYLETPIYNERFGPGWSWDDYPYYFSPENTSMPIYGNVVWIRKYGLSDKIEIIPDYFKRSFILAIDSVYGYSRYEKENLFKLSIDPLRDTIETEIPFLYSRRLIHRLLYDTLQQSIKELLISATQQMYVLKKSTN